MTVAELHTFARSRGFSVRREYHKDDVYYRLIRDESPEGLEPDENPTETCVAVYVARGLTGNDWVQREAGTAVTLHDGDDVAAK